MKWFEGGPIYIRLDPTRIDLRRSDGRALAYDPVVHFRIGRRGAYRCVGAGGALGLTTDVSRSLQLFPTETPAPADQPPELLQAFFRVALSAIMNDALIRRKPRVVVEGLPALRPWLGQYGEHVVEDALVHAGAAAVAFAPENQGSGAA